MRLTPGVWRLAAPWFVLGVPALLFGPPAALACLALGVATLLFHRDPARPAGAGIVSPADGRVSVVREEEGRLRVGVFMSPFDVHVNRAPFDGEVVDVEHVPGAYKPAFSKDSDRNERVRIDCGEFEVVLIAGWFARRIHPYVEPGDSLEKGQRIGHISYGSRADVLFPAGVTREDLVVDEGETVRAGDTLVDAVG